MDKRKRYAVVGTGGRIIIYIDGIIDTFKDYAQLVGLCDPSHVRMDWHNRRINELHNVPAVPTYHADRFDEMILQAKPDVVIVASTDCTHHKYIIRAMELGCDVICENR